VLIDMALSTAAEKKIWGAITRSLATTVIFATHMVTSDRRRLSRPAACAMGRIDLKCGRDS